MKKERIILHCDVNNFYASVECVLNPKLKTMPVAVAGNPRMRHGVILAKNQIAKEMGIKTGHVIWEAKRLCPNLICLPPQHAIYQEYSEKIKNIYKRFSDRVESFGPDECWIDLTETAHLFGSGREVADKLRHIVYEETGGLTISVGVSFNKYFAKLGSDLKKPNATTVIDKNNFKQLIWDMPANVLLMIGKRSWEKLQKLNIHTIKDLAFTDPMLLKQHFGINGLKMSAIARGEDETAVELADGVVQQKSVGNGMTTSKDLTTEGDIVSLIYLLSEKVAFRLRQKNLEGKCIHFSMKSSSFEWRGYSESISYYTNVATEIAEIALSMFKKHWKLDNLSIRAIRVSVCSLRNCENVVEQITLFDDKSHQKKKELSKIMDKMREKYGFYALRTANTLDKDFINYFDADDEISPLDDM